MRNLDPLNEELWKDWTFGSDYLWNLVTIKTFRHFSALSDIIGWICWCCRHSVSQPICSKCGEKGEKITAWSHQSWALGDVDWGSSSWWRTAVTAEVMERTLKSHSTSTHSSSSIPFGEIQYIFFCNDQRHTIPKLQFKFSFFNLLNYVEL